jgi:hypothetical protein
MVLRFMRENLDAIHVRYQQAGKKAKTPILDEF